MKELTIHYEMLLYWSLWKNEWLIMKESMINAWMMNAWMMNAWMMNAWMMNAWMMSGFFFFFLLAPILWDWGLGGFVRISASVRWWHTCKPRGIQRTDDCHPIAKGIVGRLSPTWVMVASINLTQQIPQIKIPAQTNYLLSWGFEPGTHCMREKSSDY